MFDMPRPDVTTEGWNTWPTEKVSRTLMRDARSRSTVHEHAVKAIAALPSDFAALSLAPLIRDRVERLVRGGEAKELRDSLITFALSRVDWIQLAQAEVEAALPEDDEPALQPRVVIASRF